MKKRRKKTDLEKILGNLPYGIQEELDNMEEGELKQKIVQSSAVLSENKKNMSEDPDIKQAKETLIFYKKPYQETNVAQQSVIDYCVHLLNQKGKI